MRQIFILFLSSFIFYTSYGQSFSWSESSGGEGSDQAYAIVTDADANTYVSGWFSGDAHFGDIILSSEGGKDVFLAKYNAEGEVLWAVKCGGPANNTTAGICLDWDNFPIITGWFAEDIHFGETVLESNGSYDMFVARFNNNGDVIWAKSAGGEGDDYGNRICTNLEHDVLVAGSFRYTSHFGEEVSISSEGNRDVFIANYSNTGSFQWVKQAGGEGEDRAYDIISNADGSIYFTGVFNGTASFDDYQLTSTSFLSTYIAKMDASGSFLWAKKGSGGANDYARGYGIAMDSEGYIYSNGCFSGKLSFDDETVEASGGEYDFDAYLVKYSSNGELKWLRKSGGYGMDQGLDLYTDAQGNSFVTGFFSANAFFGEFMLESLGKSDIFIAQYNWAGNVEWAKRAGGQYLDYAYSIANASSLNSLFIGGNFQEEAAFDDHIVEGWGAMDMFVTKLDYESDFINKDNVETIVVYPNPNDGNFELHMKSKQESVSIKIYSSEGKLVYSQKHKGDEIIKLKPKLSSGVYNIQIPELDSNTKLIIK